MTAGSVTPSGDFSVAKPPLLRRCWTLCALTTASLVIALSGCSVAPKTRFAPGGAPQGYAYLIAGSSSLEKWNFWILSVGNKHGRISELVGADAFIGIAIEAGVETAATFRASPFNLAGSRDYGGPWFVPEAGRCYAPGFYPAEGVNHGNAKWLPLLSAADRYSATTYGTPGGSPLMREVGADDGLWEHCEKVARMVSP